MTPLIEARGLTKRYEKGGVVALDALDLDVAAGELLAIVGPSGSGKSTLLHMLGALDRPDAGTLRFDGHDLLREPRLDRLRARALGFVFQLHNLLPILTAEENVELPLYPLRVPRSERRRRARAALEAVGLGDRMTHLPTQLSGGQRQRVAVARALVNEPRLILADEPTGNLDRRSGAEVLELLQRARVERGTSVIMVTHEASLAAEADRIVRIEDGRIVAGDAAREGERA